MFEHCGTTHWGKNSDLQFADTPFPQSCDPQRAGVMNSSAMRHGEVDEHPGRHYIIEMVIPNQTDYGAV